MGTRVRVGKGCLVDRPIPIHARTLGFGVPPHVMGVYYRVVRPFSTNRSRCMLLVQTSPPLVRTHTSNPAFPTGGGFETPTFLEGRNAAPLFSL